MVLTLAPLMVSAFAASVTWIELVVAAVSVKLRFVEAVAPVYCSVPPPRTRLLAVAAACPRFPAVPPLPIVATLSVPPLILVTPVKVFVPLRTNRPLPVIVKPPFERMPDITDQSSALLALSTSRMVRAAAPRFSAWLSVTTLFAMLDPRISGPAEVSELVVVPQVPRLVETVKAPPNAAKPPPLAPAKRIVVGVVPSARLKVPLDATTPPCSRILPRLVDVPVGRATVPPLTVIRPAEAAFALNR